MTEFERNKYLEAYYENEADANKQMSIANTLGAALILAVWIAYLTGAFYASPEIMPFLPRSTTYTVSPRRSFLGRT